MAIFPALQIFFSFFDDPYHNLLVRIDLVDRVNWAQKGGSLETYTEVPNSKPADSFFLWCKNPLLGPLGTCCSQKLTHMMSEHIIEGSLFPTGICMYGRACQKECTSPLTFWISGLPLIQKCDWRPQGTERPLRCFGQTLGFFQLSCPRLLLHTR